MRLYMKQKVFSLKQDFDIFDEDQNPVFHVEGKLFSFGRQLTIYSSETGEEVALVKQKVMTLQPQMDIYVGGNLEASIRKKLTIFKPDYDIINLGWTIRGDYFAHNYEIYNKDGEAIASINKRMLSWSDTFEFHIDNDEAHPVLVIAVILAIDAVMDADN